MRLEDGLREYALISAFDDHRFSPIKASELPNLSCNVSLLTPFTSIPDPLAWTPGVHGIHITFPHPNTGRSLSATYLPEIAKEQGWSRTETILSAISKAGYHSNNKVDPEDEDDPVWSRLKVKVYESQKATADWGEYLGWKESRDRDKEGSSDHVAEGDDEGEENVFGNGIEIGRKTNDNVKVNTKVKAKARN
ncbi:AMME syndrome candidate protein [Kwoniella heveanensis CBS 569]|nr:AMME syndrome candidate protein [Kwoniella heveanensis CBS 569]